jgi:hypothetical protein
MSKLTEEQKAQLGRRLELTKDKIEEAEAAEIAATTFVEQREHVIRREAFDAEKENILRRLALSELEDAYEADPVACDILPAPTPLPK